MGCEDARGKEESVDMREECGVRERGKMWGES